MNTKYYSLFAEQNATVTKKVHSIKIFVLVENVNVRIISMVINAPNA